MLTKKALTVQPPNGLVRSEIARDDKRRVRVYISFFFLEVVLDEISILQCF